jgi:hypothetical protein
MPPEVALLESRALRESVSTRTDVLDRVKALVLLPDGLHVTTRMVADYFEVSEKAVYSLVQRHREELESNGYRVLKGSNALELVTFNTKVTQVSGRGVAIYPRRAVLNVGMLLRDSDVARRVRTHLLDTEATAAADRYGPVPPAAYRGMPPGRWLGPGPHWDEDAHLRPRPEMYAPEHYAAFDLRQWAAWACTVDRRLDAHGRVIGAMSEQLCRIGDDVRELRGDMAAMRQDIAELRQGMSQLLPGFALGAVPARGRRRRR